MCFKRRVSTRIAFILLVFLTWFTLLLYTTISYTPPSHYNPRSASLFQDSTLIRYSQEQEVDPKFFVNNVTGRKYDFCYL